MTPSVALMRYCCFVKASAVVYLAAGKPWRLRRGVAEARSLFFSFVKVSRWILSVGR